MNGRFHLHLASQWRLQCRTQNVEVTSRKARALVAVLALSRGRRHSRESLAQLLWDGGDPQKSRASLRQVLVNLNRAFEPYDPDFLVLAGNDVSLREGCLTTDIDAVLAEIDDGLCGPDGSEDVTKLARVMADLEGVGAEFGDWVADMARQLTGQGQRQLRAVFEDDTRSLGARTRAAQGACLLDDLDEVAVRAVMTCHAQAGQSAAALRIYGQFYARLQSELDAEPSTATQDLAVAIKLMQVEGQTVQTVAATPVPAQLPLSTVAVLPFDFLGENVAPSYVALGLLDQITVQLASFRDPAVISSNSTRRYLGAMPTLEQVRQDLGAKYVVTGSVMQIQGRVAVTAQLVDTESAHVLWAQTYHCALEALFDIRASIAENIARTIVPAVNLAELRTAIDVPPERLAPYHLILRAKDLIFQLNREAFEQAGVLLHQAVTTGPTFAPAHALLSEWYAIRLWQGWSTQHQTDRRALETHVTRAISLSPGDGRAMSLWGHCRMMFERDHATALRLFDSALDLRPNDSETLIWTVPTLAYSDQPDRAIEHATRAMELSPVDPFQFRNEHFLSLAYYTGGDFDQAADLGLECFRRVPDFGSNLRMTIAALTAAGRKHEAQPLVSHHAALMPEFSVSAFIPNHGLRDATARQQFAGHLIEAGLSQ